MREPDTVTPPSTEATGQLEITHEVPAERQFIRHAGTMHLGWI